MKVYETTVKGRRRFIRLSDAEVARLRKLDVKLEEAKIPDPAKGGTSILEGKEKAKATKTAAKAEA